MDSQGDKKTQAQIEGLATILVLGDEIKKLTSLREFGFYITNETHRLVPYHTAYLWGYQGFSGANIIAQSGTAELDANAPTNQWLKRVINDLLKMDNAKAIHMVNLAEIETSDPELGHILPDSHESHTLPPYLLWCPFLNKSKEITGGLILFRETPFRESEVKMLSWLIASYQYTWRVLQRQKFKPTWRKIREKNVTILICAIILGVLLFPVHLSVLGTGTVVPRDPVLINAPLNGVIRSFFVKPGQEVQPGQLLLSFDKTDLQADYEVNKKAVDLTQAKLRTAVNQSFDNQESRSEIPTLEAQLKIDQARADYATVLLAKADVKSPSSGIVVFDSKEDWIGQPVQTGQRILFVADPNTVKLKIMLPVSNIIKLKVGSKGEFFLYGQLHPMPVVVETLGYNAKLLPSKILAYQLAAKFVQTDDKPQLGAEGSVRLYGDRVPLIYYLIRKPLQAMRQTFGI